MSAKEQDIAFAPHEIIANGKWEHALFTTYALSLTFFETHILKAGLIRNGCQHIWVIADVDGYEHTLAERQSARVGQEYHLVPVALPNGVFHPKCIYLSGPEGDVLLVGSGNLTFGGFGRNVEVLEVLKAVDCPWVFHAFGQYLETLGSRKDFMNPDPRWIKMFADLAFKASKGIAIAPAAGPHLIHCAQSSIASQLEDYFINGGGATRLRCLSPFYDPKADAVRVLSEKAGCQRVSIGLLPGQENASAFPFGVDLWKGLKLEAAVLSMKKESRPLHAKWLEADLNDGTRLTLTGSVNVTRKSMCTADNVEVGLVRLESNNASRHLEWEPAALPKRFEPCNFTKPGLGGRWVIHAHFAHDAWVEGQLIAMGQPSGKWGGFLSRPDGERVDFIANVGDDGKFRSKIPHAEHYATATAIQITLRREHNEAVGWLHMEGILNLPRLQRLGISSLLKLVNNEDSEDDDASLLEYLALCAQKHLLTFKLEAHTRRKVEPSTKSEEAHSVLRVELERLAPTTIDPVTGIAHADLPTSEQSLNDFFARLRSRMLTTLGGNGSRGISGTMTDEAMAEDEAEQKENEAKTKKCESGLEKFDQKMREMASIDGPQSYLKAVFTMWIEVGVWMRLEKLNDFEGTEFACRKWINNAVRHCHQEPGISTFDRHLITLAATLGANVIALDRGSESEGRLVQLHEHLERYYLGPVPRDFAKAALVTEPGFVFSDRLRSNSDVSLSDSLARVLNTRTFRQEIEIIRSWKFGDTLPVDLGIFKTRSGEILAKQISRNGKFEMRETRTGGHACPKCHMVIQRFVHNELEVSRMSNCQNCGCFMINLD